MDKECKKHGIKKHFKTTKHGYRCSKCLSEYTSKYRRERKQKLVDMLGGKCIVCGYNKHNGSLDFHHLDKSTKSFGIAERGLLKSWNKTVEEVEKCVLVCKNCHHEIESGITILSIHR